MTKEPRLPKNTPQIRQPNKNGFQIALRLWVNQWKLNEQALRNKRVVVLANVSELGLGAVNHLSKFVEDGGGLIIMPGDKIKIDWYRRELFRDGEGMMPQEFVSLEGAGAAHPLGGGPQVIDDCRAGFAVAGEGRYLPQHKSAAPDPEQDEDDDGDGQSLAEEPANR